MIGLEGEESEEAFDIMVYTPQWLVENKRSDDAVFGAHMIIVFRYDLSVLRSHIRAYCRRCSGKDWQEVVAKLQHLGRWEFDGYQPYQC